MFSHIFVGVSDFERALAFYQPLMHGGRSEGAPGLRPEYHADDYGAYFRDPDGDKLCVACHAAPAEDPRAGQERSSADAPATLDATRCSGRDAPAAGGPAMSTAA